MDNRTFVFIDRDGTMGGPYYVKYPTDMESFEEVSSILEHTASDGHLP